MTRELDVDVGRLMMVSNEGVGGWGVVFSRVSAECVSRVCQQSVSAECVSRVCQQSVSEVKGYDLTHV